MMLTELPWASGKMKLALQTDVNNTAITAQAFVTPHDNVRKILIVSTSENAVLVQVPGSKGSRLSFVDGTVRHIVIGL